MLGVFAGFAAIGFVAAYVGPTGAALAQPESRGTVSLYAEALDQTQTYTVLAADIAERPLERDGYSVYVAPKPTPTPTPSISSQSGSSASSTSTSTATRPMYTGGGSPAEWMAAAGIAESDWGYVDYVVKKESGWNPNATNRSSGACGLVQAYPCSKVPGNGYDPVDNLRWGNGYATGRYGSWAAAYDFWIRNNWW